MATDTTRYPKTENPNIVLDPYAHSDGRRLSIQCIHHTSDNQKVETLGYIFKGSNSYKWTAVFYGDGDKVKRQAPVATKSEAIAKFYKLVDGLRSVKIERILETV